MNLSNAIEQRNKFYDQIKKELINNNISKAKEIYESSGMQNFLVDMFSDDELRSMDKSAYNWK